MGILGGGTLRALYYAVFRPANLVAVPKRRGDRSVQEQLRQGRELLTVYLVNLALYAGPLTLAGIGISAEASVPAWLSPLAGSAPQSALAFLAGFLRNSAYLFGATVATLVGIHVALLVTFQSRGFLRTAYAVVYSTSAYLAGVFTVVWYLTTADGVANARQFVVNLQVEFIYAIIDATGADFVFGIERPDALVPGPFSPLGEVSLVLLGVLAGYYFYSLYLGARLNHDAGRFEGLAVVAIVVALPVAYVVGSILAATL